MKEHWSQIHILKLLEIMIVVSPSTVECERGLSVMKRIKSAHRSCMEQDTLKCLMKINMFGTSVEN